MSLPWPVFGHNQVRDFLGESLRQGKLHHGYLFLGPHGAGKASVARWLVQSATCLSPSEGVACGACFSCKNIMSGSHPDISWLDAAVSGGVEEVRKIIGELSRSALLGRVRVAVVENASSLTRAAQSIFLKTLEEPHEKKLMVFISGEPLLPTLLSRMQQVHFRLVSPGAIEQALCDRGETAERAHELAGVAAGRPGVAIALASSASWKEYETRRGAFLSLFLGEGLTFNTFAQEMLGKGLDDAREEWGHFSEIGLGLLREMYTLKTGADGGAGESAERHFGALARRAPLSKIGFWAKELLRSRSYVAGNTDPRFVLENFYLMIHS
ncbi:MAG: hypothetical protein AAB444_01140 [Patescibacteria group bacterium]